MGGCFQNNCSDDDVDKSQMDKVAKMLEEFKQLYADLMMVELGHLWGRISLERCEEPELEKSGVWFFLVGQDKLYARGNFLSECLDVRSKGKLFDIGLKFIN